MMRIKILLCLLALALATPLAGRSKVVLSVSNPGNSQRAEVVSFDIRKIWQALDVPEGTPLIVRNAFRQQVASQAGADGSLLIETSVLPRGTAAYTVEAGKPMAYEPLWAENPILGVLTTLPGRTTNVPTAPTALPCKRQANRPTASTFG